MALHSIVIVREVWDTRDLPPGSLDAQANPHPELVPTRFEPEDLNALEMALQIRDKLGGKVTALTLGEPRSVDVLRESLYRGVDDVIRLTHPNLEELDTHARAELTAAGVRKMSDWKLVLTGLTVAEGENSQLGAHLAALLDAELLTWVDRLEEVTEDRLVGRRAIEMGYESVEVCLPAVLSVGVALLKEDSRAPRSAKATLKLKFKKADIPVWNPESLGMADTAGSQTTAAAGREIVPERVIESKEVDTQDVAALRAMLNDILAGE